MRPLPDGERHRRPGPFQPNPKPQCLSQAFVILFNSFVVGWEVEWDAANTQDNPVIQAADVIISKGWLFLVRVEQ